VVDAALCRGAWFAGTDLAQPRTEQLQPADDVADEIGELPLQRYIMRVPMRRNPFHAGVLDPQLLLKEGDLAVSAVDLSLQPNLTILAVGRSGQQGREGVVAQGQDLEDGRADASLPASWEGQFRGHRDLRESLLSRASRRA
jgi:hypothetical protein